MTIERPSASPSDATVLQVLRDGYWDRTELIRLRDGSTRVRKMSKDAQAGPWGQVVLRSEIRYLTSLTGPVAHFFPRVWAAWDDGTNVGYEMSHIDLSRDAGVIAQAGQVDQAKADHFQDLLATVMFDHVHTPAPAGQLLSGHVCESLRYALTTLQNEAMFAPLIQAPNVRINGRPMAGTHQAAEQLCGPAGPLSLLDSGPQVRLHGDCFLENILAPDMLCDPSWPAWIVLVDPVSVAGVYEGHPLFDLVKYESYATGELLALRGGMVDVDGFERPSDSAYLYHVRDDAPALRPFAQTDWCSRFRTAYLRRYPAINLLVYHLLEGYFALVMAVCTRGVQRRARLLKATIALNAAIGN